MQKNSKPESLSQRYRRTLSRLRRTWKGEAIQLDDINVIKLPASFKGYTYGDEYSYFATRTAEGKWDIEAQKNWGGEYLQTLSLARGVELPAALNMLAGYAPESMKRETGKCWHPVYVAGLIGHEFPAENAAPAKPRMSA